MKLFEKKLQSELKFDGRIIKVYNDTVMLENDKQASREVVRHTGGVCVVALTDDNQVLMVKQFRYPYNKVILEVPAGKLNYGEDPLECGIRELKEETGAIASEYISLGKMYPSPGFLDEIIHIYLAKDLTFEEQNLDDDEFLEVYKIPLCELVDMIMKNEIDDAKTQIALLKTFVLTKK